MWKIKYQMQRVPRLHNPASRLAVSTTTAIYSEQLFKISLMPVNRFHIHIRVANLLLLLIHLLVWIPTQYAKQMLKNSSFNFLLFCLVTEETKWHYYAGQLIKQIIKVSHWLVNEFIYLNFHTQTGKMSTTYN